MPTSFKHPTPERRRRLEVKEAQASAWARAVVAEEVRARAAGRLEAAEQERAPPSACLEHASPPGVKPLTLTPIRIL